MPITNFHTALMRLPREIEFTVSITPTKPGTDFPNIEGKLVRHLNRFALKETEPGEPNANDQTPPAKKPVAKKKPTVRK